jgi:hypothetical protein
MFQKYFVFRILSRLCDNADKYCTSGQATDENIKAHALCMLDN